VPSVALAAEVGSPSSAASATVRNEKPKEIIMAAKRPDLFR